MTTVLRAVTEEANEFTTSRIRKRPSNLGDAAAEAPGGASVPVRAIDF